MIGGIELLKRLWYFIDYYPDVSVFVGVLVASLIQLVLGNSLSVILSGLSVMFLVFLITLPVNILLKNIFKSRRPSRYYSYYSRGTVFEGSFPSFHAQFAFSEATAFIVAVLLFSPSGIRFVAVLAAAIIMIPMAFLVALSRVYLKIHYPIDVVGGIIIGCIIGSITTYILAPYMMSLPNTVYIIGAFMFFILLHLLSLSRRRKSSSL